MQVQQGADGAAARAERRGAPCFSMLCEVRSLQGSLECLGERIRALADCLRRGAGPAPGLLMPCPWHSFRPSCAPQLLAPSCWRVHVNVGASVDATLAGRCGGPAGTRLGGEAR